MEHIEAVKLIQLIESERPVMGIKYKGISVWPFLRIYIADALSDTVRAQKASKDTIKSVLEGLFFYGLLPLLKKKSIWVFTNVERRKRLGGLNIHRVCGSISELENENALFWEKPGVGIRPCKKEERFEKSVISEAILLMLTSIIEKIGKPKEIEGQNIMEGILNDYDFSFNYKGKINHLFAQYQSMKLLLQICPKPKVCFIESPFSEMGVVMAFKEKNVPVIELQHGVINEHHLGYNAPFSSKEMYPDGICVYGQSEYDYLEKRKERYCKDIYQTGYYFIDKASCFFENDVFLSYRNNYKKIILVSGQVPEERMFSFTKALADNKNYLFVYVPRNHYGNESNLDNLQIWNGANIYECIKWCDIHVTMYSTTCLEAQFFHKPTIFYNQENLSRQYYGDTLSEENGCYYVDTIADFWAAVKVLEEQTIEFKEMFAHDTLTNMRRVLNKYIS